MLYGGGDLEIYKQNVSYFNKIKDSYSNHTQLADRETKVSWKFVDKCVIACNLDS